MANTADGKFGSGDNLAAAAIRHREALAALDKAVADQFAAGEALEAAKVALSSASKAARETAHDVLLAAGGQKAGSTLAVHDYLNARSS